MIKYIANYNRYFIYLDETTRMFHTNNPDCSIATHKTIKEAYDFVDFKRSV